KPKTFGAAAWADTDTLGVVPGITIETAISGSSYGAHPAQVEFSSISVLVAVPDLPATSIGKLAKIAFPKPVEVWITDQIPSCTSASISSVIDNSFNTVGSYS